MSLQKLEADIQIRSAILEKKSEHLLDSLKKEININNVMTVPLIELYVISEDDIEEQYSNTAVAIENVRYVLYIYVSIILNVFIYKYYFLLFDFIIVLTF